MKKDRRIKPKYCRAKVTVQTCRKFVVEGDSEDKVEILRWCHNQGMHMVSFGPKALGDGRYDVDVYRVEGYVFHDEPQEQEVFWMKDEAGG